MERLEIERALKTFSVLIDTREQVTDRAKKRYSLFGCPHERATLDYGDYTYNCEVNGQKIFNTSVLTSSKCVVERKMNLDELAGCFTRDRARFQREFERAKENGARIYLLVENATWENLLNGRYRSKFKPAAFEASILAWQARYDMKIIFCKEDTSGKLIKEILYRELKERLESGFY